MGYSLKIIALPVRKIIHRVNVPFVSCPVMSCFYNPVNDGIAHMHVRRSHVYPGPENPAALLKFSFIHPVEQIETLLRGAFPERTFGTRPGRSAFLGRYHIGRLIINIGKSPFYEINGKVKQLPEII